MFVVSLGTETWELEAMYLSEVGGESNREVVSFRFVSFVCAGRRTRGLVAKWSSSPIKGTHFFLFPFCHGELSLFPSPNLPNLLSNFRWAYR